MSEAPAAAPPPEPPSAVAARAISLVTGAVLGDVCARLVELQQSQQLLLSGANLTKAEVSDSAERDWRAARAVLDRVPEYTARAQRLRKAMATAAASLAKTERAAVALRGKLEDKAAERAARRRAEQAAYGGGGQ